MSTDQINYLNIGLMVISTIVAFILPFELFLFSYAVLGPLHYLTEINWLNKRNYFVKVRWDASLFVIASLLIFIGSFIFAPLHQWSSLIMYVSIVGAFVMLFIKNPLMKIALVILAVFAYYAMHLEDVDSFIVFALLLLPTVIHVFVFTGLFILYGTMKSKSGTGYLSIIIFIGCALSFFLFIPEGSFYNNEYILSSYEPFSAVNLEIGKLLNLGLGQSASLEEYVYRSDAGLTIMRFIAFAYTYHYLNWFSKTSIIKWHKVKKSTLAVTIGIWAASVILYLIDYSLGLKWLFFLSFLHVFMEFPLNYRSIIGIGEESFKMLGLIKAKPQIKSGPRRPVKK